MLDKWFPHEILKKHDSPQLRAFGKKVNNNAMLTIGGTAQKPLCTRARPCESGSTANLPTNIMDFRGFDSSIILIGVEFPGP